MKFFRSVQIVSLALTMSIAASLPGQPAQAAAPLVKTQAPGYYRMMLGEMEITALSDGTVALPVDKLLQNTTVEKTNIALKRVSLKIPLETSVNAYLINTGDRLILIDTGAGSLFGPSLGKLSTNLLAAGYKPEQIDEIYITHMHPDHVGGLMAGDKLVFPNAVVRAAQPDVDFWLSQAAMDRASADDKSFFQGAMASMNPYIKAGKFKPFTDNTELAPGIRATITSGHTPGHSIYTIDSRGQKLIVLGDLVHVAAVQFDHPEVTIQFDSDSKRAFKERQITFTDAAKQGYFVAGAHLSFPGVGHILQEGKAYAWLPINYLATP